MLNRRVQRHAFHKLLKISALALHRIVCICVYRIFRGELKNTNMDRAIHHVTPQYEKDAYRFVVFYSAAKSKWSRGDSIESG